jgi:L-2-hydroxyglutarate oxidase LhgO
MRMVSAAELREIEPNVAGVAGLHSPTTAITDYVAVTRALADDVVAAGGEVLLGCPVTGITQAGGQVTVQTGRGPMTFSRLYLCAGLQSDTVARLAGDTADPAIVPFRGEYLRLRPERAGMVNGLIYPVPDPAYPFLGVHFTRRVDGSVDVGPNAVLAMAREGYRRGSLRGSELWQTLRWPGFRTMARRHWRMGASEMLGSASRRVFVNRARRYVPDLRLDDVVAAPAGVRAQAVAADGSLVDDFRISRLGAVVAVRNAPSPAATSALAIAEHVCAEAFAS